MNLGPEYHEYMNIMAEFKAKTIWEILETFCFVPQTPNMF